MKKNKHGTIANDNLTPSRRRGHVYIGWVLSAILLGSLVFYLTSQGWHFF